MEKQIQGINKNCEEAINLIKEMNVPKMDTIHELISSMYNKGFELHCIGEDSEVLYTYADTCCEDGLGCIDQDFIFTVENNHEEGMVYLLFRCPGNFGVVLITLITGNLGYVDLLQIYYMDNYTGLILFDIYSDKNTTVPTIEPNNEDLETRVNNIEEKLDTLIKMISK